MERAFHSVYLPASFPAYAANIVPSTMSLRTGFVVLYVRQKTDVVESTAVATQAQGVHIVTLHVTLLQCVPAFMAVNSSFKPKDTILFQ